MQTRVRRIVVVVLSLIGFAFIILAAAPPIVEQTNQTQPAPVTAVQGSAMDALEKLLVKGRAPKTDYARSQFGSGWTTTNGCDTRNIILYRDLKETTLDAECVVASGLLLDPYTATTITYTKGSSEVQIDHVVALSNAWQTGAQELPRAERIRLANDPLELLAVQGDANQQKGDSDAASWLPSNKSFRCQYIARQIAIKSKYSLWVTESERQAMVTVLASCPDEALPFE